MIEFAKQVLGIGDAESDSTVSNVDRKREARSVRFSSTVFMAKIKREFNSALDKFRQAIVPMRDEEYAIVVLDLHNTGYWPIPLTQNVTDELVKFFGLDLGEVRLF